MRSQKGLLTFTTEKFNMWTLLIIVHLCFIWLVLLMRPLQTVIAVSASFVVILLFCWFLYCLLQKLLPKQHIFGENKAVVITGCDSGFGHLLTISLLEKYGFTVYACCLFPNSEHIKCLSCKYGKRLKIVAMDVTDDEAVRQAYNCIFSEITEKNERLQALVNNAGIIVSSEIEWGSIENYSRVFETNVLGMVRVTRQFLPLIRSFKSRIINMGSVSSHFTAPTLSAYSMSKYAVVAFTNGLRREMEKWDVPVVLVEPDIYQTPMTINNALIDSLETCWTQSNETIRELYGNYYFEATKQYLRNNLRTARKNPEEVIDVLQEAIASKTFRIHYICCGVHNRIIIWLFDIVPPQLIEPFVRLYTVRKRPAGYRSKVQH